MYLAACLVIHELGHFLAALVFSERLRFRFEWGRFCVPRFVWDMPDVGPWKQRVIAAAGFCFEALAAIVFAVYGEFLPLLFFAVHFAAYPFYAGDSSDFNFF